MGDNTIHYSGHIRMMGAVQPFISGAISKTVNMPEDVTVEDVEQLHIDAWRLGIKAVAIYRDNCKVAQPLSTTKKDGAPTASRAGTPRPPAPRPRPVTGPSPARIAELEAALAHERARAESPLVVGAVRERLPRKRNSKTFSFRVADCEGYVTVGEYEDGRPGEVFVKVSKQGSTLAGIMDAFSISISLGPAARRAAGHLRAQVRQHEVRAGGHHRRPGAAHRHQPGRLHLPPAGARLPPHDERAELGILSTQERTQPTLPGVEEMATPSVGLVEDGLSRHVATRDGPSEPADHGPLARAEQLDAPLCYNCGNAMQRAGSCYVCGSCGSTSGCS